MNEINSEAKELTAEPKLRMARVLHCLNAVVTLIVLVAVGLMRRIEKFDINGIDFSFLPPVYSLINLFAALLLILALQAILKRKIWLHKLAINGAMLCSMIFLICYVIYHFTTEETRFGGTGWIRPVYFTLLISHIVLAAVSLPLILLAWTYGMTNQFSKHRRLVRFVFPMWLYVTLTGPACYLMLRPYY